MTCRHFILGGCWIAMLMVGFWFSYAYDNSAGANARAPGTWPIDTTLQLSDREFTLLLFAHPHCPCTRATFAELARLLEHHGDRIETTVLFVLPPDAPDDWADVATWRADLAIDGARVLIDGGSEEANRFSAATSGQVLLYGVDGRLLFSGGITPSRGHQGENLGRSAIESIVLGGSAALNRSSVFGCPLLSPATLGGKTLPTCCDRLTTTPRTT